MGGHVTTPEEWARVRDELAEVLSITPVLAEVIVAYPAEFVLGLAECQTMTGMIYDNDPDAPRSTAYDLGRSLGDGRGPNGMAAISGYTIIRRKQGA